MPMYTQSIPSGYRFRRMVPEPLRAILGRGAIIVSLGKDYGRACRRAREEAVRSDQIFDQAKAKLDQREARLSFSYERLTPITEVTEDLKQQLQAYWLSVVDAADQERRTAPKSEDVAEEREEFRREARSMLETLKAAWREGNVDPFLPALHTTLAVRGYRLEMPMEDQRRLFLQFLRAALAGYKLLEAWDEGEDPPLNLPAQVLPAGSSPIAAQTPTKPKSAAAKRGLTLYSLFEYWRDSGVTRAQKTIDDVERRILELDALTQGKPR